MANLRLLLVDDEPDVIRVMKARISSWGFDVVEAEDAKTALEALISKNLDIVVLDYSLPGMDGLGVLKEIRKIDKKIPVILFTAYLDEELKKKAQKLGANAFIPKVSASDDVQHTLKSTLDMIKKNLNSIR
ncbi:MAG: response regulator [Candidatus Omnitrophica bacterium]|nr:response regulator [Candidatus Omnitrophota bacterium]